MKKFLVLSAVLLSLGACSSTGKKDVDDAKDNTVTKTEEAKSETTDQANKSESDTQMQASKTSCTLDQDTRVIEVKKTDGGGCELFYTKFGEAKSVASSGFGIQYCEEVKDRIQSNLNKAGFTCQ